MIISAYSCRPNSGSEQGAGWNALQAGLLFSKNVVLITKTSNKKYIIGNLAPEMLARLEIITIDGRSAGASFGTLSWPRQAKYILWLWAASRKVGFLLKTQSFDLAHHATFASEWLPNPFSSRSDLTICVGPIGGLAGTPKNLRAFLGARGQVADFFRRLIGPALRNLVGAQALRNVTVTILQNSKVRLPFNYKGKIQVFQNIALDLENLPKWEINDSTEFIGAGRLVPWKGWRLAITALSSLDSKYRLTIIGDGPDQKKLEKYIRRLNMAARVRIVETMPREDLLAILSTSKAICIPSFHDAAGWIAGESLSIGIPTIGLDSLGIGDVLRLAGATGTPVELETSQILSRYASSMLGVQPIKETMSFARETYYANLEKAWMGAISSIESFQE